LGDAVDGHLGNHDLAFNWPWPSDPPGPGARYVGRCSGRSRSRCPCWNGLAGRPLFHEDHALKHVHRCIAGLGAAKMGFGPGQSAMRLPRRIREQALRRDPGKLFDPLYGGSTGPMGRCPRRRATPAIHRELALHACATSTRRPVDVARAKDRRRNRQTNRWFPGSRCTRPRWRGPRIVFGHWSTLGFFQQCRRSPRLGAWIRLRLGRHAHLRCDWTNPDCETPSRCPARRPADTRSMS